MRSSDVRLLPGLAVLATACSLLFPFDPNGQPCDSSGGCLPGYGCVANKCVRGADGGSTLCGGIPCFAGERCLPFSHRCVNDDCTHRKCVPGDRCAVESAATACAQVPAGEIGASCISDSNCPGSFCWTNAQIGSGTGPRTGVCALPCTGGACPADAGLTCQTFTMELDGGSTSVCLPPDLLWPCANDLDCADDGLVCTLYDHPLIGPATICDVTVDGGAPSGAPCAPSNGRPCYNGLCVPTVPDPGESTFCAATCSAVSCPSGQHCVLAEVVVGVDRRFAPVCSAHVPTICTNCSTGASCGPDAPHCGMYDGGSVCLPLCGTGGLGITCPPNLSCTGGYCVPAMCP